MDLAPPSYASSLAPPSYTVAPGPSNPPPDPAQRSLGEYVYKTSHLTLNLGPRRFGSVRPSYGWNDLVEGFVQVKKNTSSAQSIVVRVEGEITTGSSERGFLVDHDRKTILRMSKTLFESTPEQPTVPQEGVQYHFSFPLPSYITGGSEALPATSSLWYSGIAANITYYVWVEMIRKGRLRSNERLKACFHYLPRTYAPIRTAQVPLSIDESTGALACEKSSGNDPQPYWEIFPVESTLSEKPSTPSDLRVTFALPRPLTYASGQDIPFILRIRSTCTTEAISLLLSSLSVQLCRVMIISSREKWTRKETILAGGEVYQIEEHGQERVMHGNITCPIVAGESSWELAGLQVKHLIRMTLAPPKDLPGLSAVLPTYTQSVLITMRTHQAALEGVPDDVHLPALCRLPRVVTGGGQ